jgi:hypothetical protein
MTSSSNLLVLGATGQVGKLVAKTLKRRGASFSVGREGERIWKSLQINVEPRGSSISMTLELPTRLWRTSQACFSSAQTLSAVKRHQLVDAIQNFGHRDPSDSLATNRQTTT